jgi:hypothetical protein
MNEAYRYLKRNGGEATTPEVHEWLRKTASFHLPDLNTLGSLLSRCPLFEKVERIPIKMEGGSRSTTTVWRARSLREIVDRAMITNSSGKNLPNFFRQAIEEERGRLNAENSMVEE